jgi:hypothetical protein
MWQINRITKETLLNISKYSNKVIKLAKYFQESNQPFVMQELMNMSDQTDQIELLEAFDKDISKTVNEFYEIQKLLITVDDEGNIKELKNDTKNLKDIFNENYNIEEKKVTFPSAILDLNKPKAKKEIREELIENVLQLSMPEYKQLLKIKDMLKDVDKDELSNDNEKINYLVNKSNIDFVKDNVDKINKYVKSFVEIRKNLDFEEKELIDKKITSSRTMIDGVLNDSTFISLKDNIEQISQIHLRDNENGEDLIKEIKKELEESKYINSVEIDKDTDLDKFLFLLKKVKGLHLNLTKEFEFKTRKLGNYRANGLYINDNKTLIEQKGYHNTEYNIVALDVNSPSSLVYELTNLVGLSNEEFSKSPLRRAVALHFKSKINNNILQENGLSPNYLTYLRDTKKVMARLGEIGYILNKYDYKSHEDKEDLSHFFDKVKLLEKMEHKGDKEIPIVHKIDFYRENSAQYFDIDNLHTEELKIIKNYFKSYYNTINNEFSPLENTSILRTLEKLKEDQKLRQIQEAIIEEEQEESDKPTVKKRRYDQEEFPVSKVNLNNIKSVLEYNDKDKIFTEKELCTFLSENVNHISRKKYSLKVGEAEDKIKIFIEIFKHGEDTNNEILKNEVFNALALKRNQLDYVEIEKILQKKPTELKALASFIPELSYNNRTKLERIVVSEFNGLLNKVSENLKPIPKSNNNFISIDKAENEEVMDNRLEHLKSFDKDSIFLHNTILELSNKFTEIGGHVKNVIVFEKNKDKENLIKKEDEPKIKNEMKEYAKKIDDITADVALKKVREIISKETSENFRYYYNNNLEINDFNEDFLLKNGNKLISNYNENTREENLKKLSEINFKNIDKELLKDIFSDIKLKDLNLEKHYSIARRNYVPGVLNIEPRILQEVKIEENFKDMNVSLNVISSLIGNFKTNYIYEKACGVEINKDKLYEVSKSQAIDETYYEAKNNYSNSKRTLEKYPDVVVFLKKTNKKVLNFLEEKGILEDYVNNFKKMALEHSNYKRSVYRPNTFSKLSGLLSMQGVDLESPNAIDRLRKEINQKNSSNKNKPN